jgi:hypothetical protein
MAEDYYFDLTNNEWIESIENPEPLRTGYPEWGAGDVREATVTFVRRNGISVIVEQSLTAAQIGVAGTLGGAVLTSATAGTPSAAWAYPFTINFAVAAVTSFIGTTEDKTGHLEFRLSTTAGPKRHRTRVRMMAQVLSDAVADPIAPEVALTRNEAAGIYLSKDGAAGEFKKWTSPDGTITKIQYLGNDGQMHFDDV